MGWKDFLAPVLAVAGNAILPGAGGIIGGAVGSAIAGSGSKTATAANNASNSAINAANMQAQIGAEQWNRYKDIYDPLERSIVADAQKADDPVAYANAAGLASATVSDQFGKMRDRIGRIPGVDPSSGAYQDRMLGLEGAQAAQDAVSQNDARLRQKNIAREYQLQAMNMGKGLPATASGMLSSAVNNQSYLANQQNQLGLANATMMGSLANRLTSPDITKQIGGWLNGLGNSGGVQPAWTSGQDLPMGTYVEPATWGTGGLGQTWMGPG